MNENEIIGLLGSFLGCSIILLIVAGSVFVWWKIFAKAGYNGAMGLLMIVPLVNLIMLLVLAFGEWPVLRELDRLRKGGDPPREWQ